MNPDIPVGNPQLANNEALIDRDEKMRNEVEFRVDVAAKPLESQRIRMGEGIFGSGMIGNKGSLFNLGGIGSQDNLPVPEDDDKDDSYN